MDKIPEPVSLMRRRIAELIALPLAESLEKGRVSDAFYRLTVLESHTFGSGLRPELGLSQKLGQEVQKAYDRYRSGNDEKLAEEIRFRFSKYFGVPMENGKG